LEAKVIFSLRHSSTCSRLCYNNSVRH